MESGSSTGSVNLPPGVTIGAGRETAQTDEQGMVVQGMAFPIKLPNGSTSTIFIPYSELHNTAQVRQLIDSRVRAIMAISG